MMIYTPFFDWDSVRGYFEEKARCLQRAEKKNNAWMGFSPDRYTVYEVEDRRFIVVMSRTFEGVLLEDLPRATQDYPNLFGTGNPDDVIEALFNVRSGYESSSLAEYGKDLSNEKFAWIVEVDRETLHPINHFIRVDLFRGIANNDFQGGVMHSFKHFAHNGVPLSHKRDNNNIDTTADIIPIIISGFFLSVLNPIK